MSCGDPVCNGIGVCNADSSACECPIGMTIYDAQCRYGEFTAVSLAIQVFFLLLNSAWLAGCAWRLPQYVRAYLASKRSPALLWPVVVHSTMAAQVLCAALFWLDPDAFLGIWPRDKQVPNATPAHSQPAFVAPAIELSIWLSPLYDTVSNAAAAAAASSSP
jgi:hypothetical protein